MLKVEIVKGLIERPDALVFDIREKQSEGAEQTRCRRHEDARTSQCLCEVAHMNPAIAAKGH